VCNFWATWCAPCREEIPILVAAKQQLPIHGTEIVGIGIDFADKIREFAATYHINYPLLLADATALTLLRSLGNRAGALPYTVGLDRSGAIVERHLGALKQSELRKVLESLAG
jgi:thiol-disulfide isomerase/thioredoxin